MKKLPSTDYERHHVLWERRHWTAGTELQRLRNTKELIIPIKTIAHSGLHRAIEQMPAPDHKLITRINNEFYPSRNDPLQTIANLQEAVKAAIESPYVSDLARTLGGLMVSTLDAQLPFIIEGIE